MKQAISQESVSDSSHSCIQEVCESTASSSSIKSAAMLGLALSVGASGVFTAQSEASAAIAIPEASATNQAFSSDFKVSAPATSASQAQIVAYHTVESGQSLWQIAQLHRVGLRDLKSANELPIETSIRVGQVLKVPGSADAAQSPTQRTIQNLATGQNLASQSLASENLAKEETEPPGLVADSTLALEDVETVAKTKISEQSLSTDEELASADTTRQEVEQAALRPEVPKLDEARVSIEVASVDIISSEQPSATANVDSDEALAAEVATPPAANPTASVEFEIADAAFTEELSANGSTPVVTALAAPTQTFNSYQVQAGDTIADIASSLGTTAAELISANELANPDVIMPGATLIVPTGADVVARQLSQPKAANGSTEGSSENSRLAYLQRTAIRQSASADDEIQSENTRSAVADEASNQTAAQGGVDPYVANLLEEVQEIQSEPIQVAEAEIIEVENRVSPSSRAAERVAIAPTQSTSADSSLLAAAPISPDAYVPAQRSPAGQVVSPDMPLLPEADEFLPEAPDYFNGYIWPTRGTLTSGYGWRWGRMHRGVDVAGPVGTPVVAAGSGVIESAGWNSGGYGNMVEIRHPDGSLTLYAHNNRLSVSTGQAVKQGQKIAEMGSTGYSTGPHLHFEVHLSGKGAVNPIAHLPSR